MSGSISIEPARFSWFTNLSMFSLVDLDGANNWQIDPSSLFSMQAQNSISLFDVAFDFSFTFHPGRAYDQTLANPWSTSIDDYLTFQGIQGFYDFKPKSLRLIFGNVNDYLGYSTDSIGIALEKRYAYGDATPKTHQFEYEVVVEEPSTVEVFINERSVYRRELQAGIYKLRDFAFTQGANSAKVVISPLANPTLVEELDFLLGYDSRLLAKGDTLYSLSLSFPEYNIGKTTFRVNQQLGLTNTITGSYALALSPTAITLGLTGLFASPWGSFDTLLGASYSTPLALGFASKVNYRITGSEDSPFGSFDVSLGLETRNYNTSLNVNSSTTAATGETWSATTSYSGSIGEFFRYSLGASLSWLSGDSNPNWRLTASTGIPLIPNMSVSGSISLYASPSTPTPQLRGQIGMNYAFTPNLSMSASTDLETSTYASASWRPFGSQNDNMQFSFSSIDFTDPLNHQGSISYSHSDTAYGLSIRQQYSDRFTRFSTSLSLNTAFGYAGGLFGMTRSVGDNFLLVKPSGAMKGGDIAVTRTMTSEPSALPSLFGVSMFTGITTHQQNNVVVYGIGDSMLNSSGSFIYNFLPRPRQGYAVRIESEATYSIVGTLLRSPAAAYSRYTTDLYRVVVNEAGEEELVFDETLYLFTDENGFFFLSGVAAGEYQFSLFLPESSDEDPPVDIRFIISPDPNEKDPQVFILETFVASAISEALEQEFFADLMGNDVQERILDENGYYWMEIQDVMDELEFWDTYYPSRQVLDSVSVQEQTGTDSIVEFIPSEAVPTTALARMARENEQQLFNLARLRSIIKPYLDAIDPKPEWNPMDR
jgi:outer membrane usher protein